MKPRLVIAFLYLIVGILISLSLYGLLSIVLFALIIASVFGSSIANDSIILGISILFILSIVGIFPLCIYLSRFWGKSRVYLVGIVICAIAATVFGTIRYQQLNNTEIIEITPQPVNVK